MVKSTTLTGAPIVKITNYEAAKSERWPTRAEFDALLVRVYRLETQTVDDMALKNRLVRLEGMLADLIAKKANERATRYRERRRAND